MGPSMRLVTFFAVVCMLAAPAAQRPSAFLPVAVEYAAGRDATRASIASDLQVIRSLHFNSIRYTLRWSDAEPARGTLMVEPLERVLEAATQSGLRVIVRLETGAPAWVFARYADAWRRTSDEAAPRAACFDHPAVRGDMWRFVTAASKTAVRVLIVAGDRCRKRPSARVVPMPPHASARRGGGRRRS